MRIRSLVLFGLALLSAIAPLKFTSPVVLYHLAYWPQDFLDWIFSSWPNSIFYAVIIFLAFLGLRLKDWRELKNPVWIFPGFFLVVQISSTFMSIDLNLSREVLWLLVSLALGYLIGAQSIQSRQDLSWILLGWVIGSLFVVWIGISQATGGLEETRQFLYSHPELAKDQPGLWKKIESNRIFSTFVYPNALGGYIVSAIFAIAAWGIGLRMDMQKRYLKFRWCVSSVLIFALIYCLWKSGSKGSYAVLFIAIVFAIFLWMPRRKFMLIGLLFFVSLAGFIVGYGSRAFEQGQKTWSARVSYWKAALQIGLKNPVLGTGPGTFAKMYPLYKKTEDEATRLAHNNYLQMWSDSGFLGFISFVIWVPGSLFLWWYRWKNVKPQDRIIESLVWCACTAFALHSLVDFDLYMPSNSAPIFVLLGYLANSPPRLSFSFK